MKKIILSAFITTALVGATFAAAPSPAFTGFYIGAGATHSSGKIKADNNATGNTTARGVGANAFLGYGQVIQGGLYLGGEFSFGLDGSRFKRVVGNTTDGFTVKSGSRFTYNIAARLGYAFCEFLPYVKLGYEGRSKITFTTFEAGESESTSFKRNGFLLGAGADYAVTKNVFIRGEYHYNFGSKKKAADTNVKTPTQTFLIGAGYRF